MWKRGWVVGELELEVIKVEAAHRGMVPLLNFEVRLKSSGNESIQGVLLTSQIQMQTPQRAYSGDEKGRLVELFGTPERWGQTLRNRLWAHVSTTVGPFSHEATTVLSVPCTYDLNVATAKYLYALESGDVPLLFLFSGSVFYVNGAGQLQVERISWKKESTYRMPIQVWRDLMEQHFPNHCWLYLQRDVFERLYSYKRQNGLTTWEQVIERLLAENSSPVDLEVAA